MRHPTTRQAVLSTKIPERLRKRLERIASRRRVPVSVVVREALEAATRAEAHAESFTSRAGDLCGSLSGPKDLSSNPAHLGGYGT